MKSENQKIVSEYLQKLKERENISFEELEKRSGIPKSTIVKIVGGYTNDPRIETTHKLLVAMGGSFDEMFNKKNAEYNRPIQEAIAADELSLTSQQHLHDGNCEHIKTLKKTHAERIEEIKAMFREQIEALKEQISSLKKDRVKLSIAVCVLMAFIIILFSVDICLGSVGWIQR